MASGTAGRGETLAWTWAPTALGRWLVAGTAQGVCFLALDAPGAPAALGGWAARALPGCAPAERDTPLLDAARHALAGYAAGGRRGFDLPLDLRGTPFQRSVWEELTRIPYGATRTYGELAARLGRPGAARAVGLAAGRNPVPVIVPCHRLVAATGLGGFSAGIRHKRALLVLEGRAGDPQGELAFEPEDPA